MTQNQEMINAIQRLVPADWQMVVVTDLEDLGDWNEILLYRFLLLDLDEVQVFDPLDVIRQLRMQMQINIPVFCFGGDSIIQNEMRLSRADRFFKQSQLIEMLPEFFKQYDWG